MSRVIFIDTETGGLDPSTDALLAVGIVHWQDGEIVGQREILVKAEGLRVTPEALAVNRIDLAQHEQAAVGREDAALRVVQEITRGRDRGARIAGHNVAFDVDFLRELVGTTRWRRAVYGSAIDTLALLTFLEHAGKTPPKIGRLDAACLHFGIEIDPSRRHTAVGDADATARLYTALLGLIR